MFCGCIVGILLQSDRVMFLLKQKLLPCPVTQGKRLRALFIPTGKSFYCLFFLRSWSPPYIFHLSHTHRLHASDINSLSPFFFFFFNQQNRFIWEQQTVVIWDIQPRQTTCNSSKSFFFFILPPDTFVYFCTKTWSLLHVHSIAIICWKARLPHKSAGLLKARSVLLIPRIQRALSCWVSKRRPRADANSWVRLVGPVRWFFGFTLLFMKGIVCQLTKKYDILYKISFSNFPWIIKMASNAEPPFLLSNNGGGAEEWVLALNQSTSAVPTTSQWSPILSPLPHLSHLPHTSLVSIRVCVSYWSPE